MMVPRKLLLVLSVLGLSSAKPCVPHSVTRRASVMDLHGGAGPIDARTAAKVLTGIFVLQGSTGWLASEASLKTYDVLDCTPKQKVMAKTMSANCKCIEMVCVCVLHRTNSPPCTVL
jgi:hypothetical protein